jgi:Flp pilus assembly protein TadG
MALVRRFRNEDGQAVVEFAVLATVLCTLLVAIFEVGGLLSDYLEVTEASRVAARTAATYGASDVEKADTRRVATEQAEAAVVESAGDDVEVTMETPPLTSWTAGNPVKATTRKPYTLRLIGVPVKSGWLSSSTTMRIERRSDR